MVRTKTDRWLQGVLVVLVGLFVYAIYASVHETVVNAGDSAPDFAITTRTGRTITRSNFGGKLLILNFWATWCQPCVEETPSLNALQQRLANRGLVVLGVSVDKDQDAYRRFIERNRVSFETAWDPGESINAKYGTFQYPESYIIDSQGKVLYKVVGMTDWTDEKMVNYVQSFL